MIFKNKTELKMGNCCKTKSQDCFNNYQKWWENIIDDIVSECYEESKKGKRFHTVDLCKKLGKENISRDEINYIRFFIENRGFDIHTASRKISCNKYEEVDAKIIWDTLDREDDENNEDDKDD